MINFLTMLNKNIQIKYKKYTLYLVMWVLYVKSITLKNFGKTFLEKHFLKNIFEKHFLKNIKLNLF